MTNRTEAAHVQGETFWPPHFLGPPIPPGSAYSLHQLTRLGGMDGEQYGEVGQAHDLADPCC